MIQINSHCHLFNIHKNLLIINQDKFIYIQLISIYNHAKKQKKNKHETIKIQKIGIHIYTPTYIYNNAFFLFLLFL